MNQYSGTEEKPVSSLESCMKYLEDASYLSYKLETSGTVLTEIWEEIYKWRFEVSSPTMAIPPPEAKREERRFHSKWRTVCYDLAVHPNLPIDTLTKIVNSGIHAGRIGAIRNPNITHGLFTALRVSEDKTVREALTASSNCPPELLKVLKSDNWATMKKVAANPNTPVDVLVGLTQKHKAGDRRLLVDLVCNPSLPVGEGVQILSCLRDSHLVLSGRVPLPLLVGVLKADYPEVTDALPREWLEQLWVSCEDSFQSKLEPPEGTLKTGVDTS